MEISVREQERKHRKLKFWLKFILVILLVGAAVFMLKAPYFNVLQYEVEGNSYYQDEEILTMGNCKTGGNIFIGSNTGEIKSRLLKDAYIGGIKIKRKLPNTIVLQVDERAQLAAIVYGQKYIVIDGDGIVLRKTGVEPKLTIISGLTITKLTLGEEVEAEQNSQLRKTLEILRTMEDHNMYFVEVEIKKTELRAHILENLICEGTAEHIKAVIESNDLQIVVQELFNKEIERGTLEISGDNYISFSPKVS